MLLPTQLSSGLALLIAASSLATADPLRVVHKRAGAADSLHVKRQATGAASLTALDILTAALPPIPSFLPQVTTTSSVDRPNDDSASTTTGASPATTTDASPNGAYIRVEVVQPSLCSESALQFSSSWSVPTGTIDIQTESGWGEYGSLWNISANDGVQLKDFRVPCQGSACTGITGNKEEDGSITQNPDGSWSMNVTANMQPSVGLFGNAAGGSPTNGTYDLTITSTPPCGLPVFQNCSGRKFDPTADQWDAYSTGDFLTRYLSDNNIDSLADLLSKASSEFLPTTDAQGLVCNPDAGQVYECGYPSYTQCDSSSKDSTAGFLVVAGAIVTAVSSIVGLFTFIAIIADAVTVGAATGFLVAAIVGVQSTLAAAANFKNGFEKQKPDSTYLAIDGNYSQSKSTELTKSGIATALASGAWLDVPNPYNVSGIGEQARDWLDNLLVTSYINRVFNDADAFITFFPYGKTELYGIKGREHDFTEKECRTHWNNDPSWDYFSTCDVPLGGTPGMAVVTRPYSQGKSSKDWTSKVEWQWASYMWDSHAFVESAVSAYAEHGFNYNLTDVDFSGLLNKGSQEAINQWKTLPLSTPGLFNIPVCEISSMSDIPGSLQVAIDMGVAGGTHNHNPKSCTFSNTTASGAEQLFCDNVSPQIKKAVGCP
ncbi:MAG: hypothetical protein Q9173_004734 [Seirophora scorigena]